jgi:tetratricopeptide (TPR) repeat protein
MPSGDNPKPVPAPSTDVTFPNVVPSPGTAPWAVPAEFGGGRYKVRSQLGEGGQKLVFLAWDTELERDAVISLLRTESLSEEGVYRLKREARAMAQLGDHPNIVTVHDLGEEGGRPYIVCQYVPGGSLRDLCRSIGNRRLGIERAIRLGHEIAGALKHAHGRGIVHRDLKPANVWLTAEGTAKLGDFGVALPASDSHFTQPGMVVGTVVYLSPEQAQGQVATFRSDLYSLGILLYELVCGRPPFQGDHAAGILWQHVYEPPILPTFLNQEIPAGLEALIMELLAKDPARRPASAELVAQRLEEFTPSQVAAGAVTPEPTSIGRLAGGVFVGRDRQLAELHQALSEAHGGKGAIRLLAGEAGSGKTRTAEQLCAYARVRRAVVFVGRCFEGEGSPAFWPWLQIIREFTQGRDPSELRRVFGAGAGPIAELVPEIADQVSSASAAAPLEPAQARFRLFDSVTTLLKNVSAEKPLLLVLEDLHWADQPSLRLLEFLAREIASSRLLVLGTYRDQGLDRTHPLSQTLAELARHSAVGRLDLPPLGEVEVARYIELTAGVPPAESLVRIVFERTEGSPFFMSQLVKLLVTEGVLDDPEKAAALARRLPGEIREVILRRISALPAECAAMLAAASVLGREFTLPDLAVVSGISEDELLDLIEGPLTARVVAERGEPGRFLFTHALIRETLYAEMSATRRVRLHRRAAEVLEESRGRDPLALFTEMAYHRFRCGAPADTLKAIEFSLKAAQEATRVYAYEEAAAQYERALQALPGESGHDRCDLLLALAEALKRSGAVERARETFQRAAELARQASRPEKLAMAALGIGVTMTGAFGEVDQVQIQLLQEALEKLPPGDSPLRAKLLAQLANSLYYFTGQRVALSEQALAIARRVGDPAALQMALYSRHVALMLTERFDERLAVSEEFLRLAGMSGSKEVQLRARYRRIIDATETGAMPALDQEIEAYTALAGELRQPAYLWMARHFAAARSLMRGRFQEAGALAQQALALGQKAQDPTASLFAMVVMSGVYCESGTPEKSLDTLLRVIEKYPLIPGNRSVLSFVYCHMGKFDEAAAQLDLVAARDFEDLPRDGSFIVVLSGLAQVCYLLKDRARASKLYPMLLPYAGRMIMSGNSAVAFGWISRPLGLLSATLGRWDEAVAHYEVAIRKNTEADAPSFLAGSRIELAETLLERNAPGDRESARAQIVLALTGAAAIGAKGLTGRAEQALRQWEAGATAPGSR